MRCWTIALLVCTLGFSAWGQQHWAYSQFMFNPFEMNGALAGSYDRASVSLRHRSQWIGLEGAPVSQQFAIHGPVARLGAGVRVNHEQIGLRSQTSARVSVAYPLALASGELRFALGGGLVYDQWHTSQATLHDPDESFATGAPNLSRGVLDAALSFQAKTWYAGVEALNLNAPEAAVLSWSDYRLQTQINGIVGVEFVLDERNAIRPAAALRWTANHPLSAELCAAWLWNDRLWVGGGYRLNYGALAHVQYAITPVFRLGYAYDHTVGPLANSQTGSHEAFLGWTFTSSKSSNSVRHFQ